MSWDLNQSVVPGQADRRVDNVTGAPVASQKTAPSLRKGFRAMVASLLMMASPIDANGDIANGYQTIDAASETVGLSLGVSPLKAMELMKGAGLNEDSKIVQITHQAAVEWGKKSVLLTLSDGKSAVIGNI